MEAKQKDLMLRILSREKQKLDNASVIGGFSSFLKNWLMQRDEEEAQQFIPLLEGYPALSTLKKRELLSKIEVFINGRASVPPRQSPKVSFSDLRQPVRYLKGVGPALEKKLNRLEIYTVEDLLYFFPRVYRDRGQVKPIRGLTGKSMETVQGRVVAHQRHNTRRGMLLKIMVSDGTGMVTLVCFNRNYLAQVLPKGTPVLLWGNFQHSAQGWETTNFDFQVGDTQSMHFERIIPVYSLTEGLNPKRLRSIILSALENFLPLVEEVLPARIREKYGFPAKKEAIRELHCPLAWEESLNHRRSQAHLALIFEEFLLFALSLKMRRLRMDTIRVEPCPTRVPLVEKFLQVLPFELTAAQKRVYGEIVRDLASGRVMNRLIQGDVGSGKTIVALLSALHVIGLGKQVAFMVPTEILAEQHYFRSKELLSSLGVRVHLLKGGASKEKKMLLQRIREKEVDLVIGTHALIEEKVAFGDLGLVIVDEQHRFGVIQRARLKEKAVVPHTLVMTATPIPRTLALTLYGDLDISIIDEKPAGRKPVETLCFSLQERFKAYQRLRKRVEEGRQGYVVCPAIEESDEEISNVKAILELLRSKWMAGFEVEMIHGRLPSREKEEIMRRFEKGEIQVLVATSVIEVGIDVPNASVMVIENAERFGLAQLHQLRGRIGRGSQESLCILLASLNGEDIRRRMNVMVSTNDGFQIAEEDLRLRGPGEFYGVRQHGVPEFRLANPLEDWSILEKAHQEAELILLEDPSLGDEYASLRKAIEQRFGRYLSLGEIG
ncbi:MAG: ATP-dependent DNA helicase RecG [Candidatus Caldatribacteriaceae bacterium]